MTSHSSLIDLLERQKAFSSRAFGPGARTNGIVEHIRKELVEIEESPQDLYEWIDVALLSLDGAWRSGHTPEQVADALLNKLSINENRVWPDWRNYSQDDAIEHVD